MDFLTTVLVVLTGDLATVAVLTFEAAFAILDLSLEAFLLEINPFLLALSKVEKTSDPSFGLATSLRTFFKTLLIFDFIFAFRAVRTLS